MEEITMSWIQLLAEYIRQLWPFWIVKSFQRGIKFRFGRDIKELGPGKAHFAFWFFEEIIVVSVMPMVINLPSQTFTTSDGVIVTFSANIEFEVTNARNYYCKVQHFEASLINAAMRHLAKRVRRQTYAGLIERLNELENSTRETMTNYVKEWGVKINDIGLTDLAKSRPLRLFQDPGVK